MNEPVPYAPRVSPVSLYGLLPTVWKAFLAPGGLGMAVGCLSPLGHSLLKLSSKKQAFQAQQTWEESWMPAQAQGEVEAELEE